MRFRFHRKQNARNWVSSEEPLDTAIPNMVRECPKVSAGEYLLPFPEIIKTIGRNLHLVTSKHYFDRI